MRTLSNSTPALASLAVFVSPCPCESGVPFSPALASPRFRFPLLLRVRGSVFPCSCGSEFPFGRSLSRFFVMEVGFGKACRFRFGRVAKRNGAIAVRDGFLVRNVREDNRVSGCMSVAGLGARIHHRRMVQFRGSRRGKKVWAKGLDSSPRNGWMVRTGVREGWKWKCFLP